MSKITEDLIQYKIEALAARKILNNKGDRQADIRDKDLNLYRDIRLQNTKESNGTGEH